MPTEQTEKSFQLLKEETRVIALPVSQLLFVVRQGIHLVKLPFSLILLWLSGLIFLLQIHDS